MVVTDMGPLKGRLFRITARVVYTRQRTNNPMMIVFFVSIQKKTQSRFGVKYKRVDWERFQG